MAGTTPDYSTLEVVDGTPKKMSSTSRAVTAAGGDGMQVARDESGLEAVQPEKETYYVDHTPAAQSSKEPFIADNVERGQQEPETQRPLWKKKRFFVTAIVILAVIAVALGAALGTTLKSKDDDSGSAQAEGSGTGNSTTATNGTSSGGLMQHSIAAVAVEDGNVNRTWVFYRNNGGKILRSGATGNGGPYTTTQTGVTGKEGTALTAAVSRPGYPLEMQLFYIGDDYTIRGLSYAKSTGLWTANHVSDQNFTVMPNSSLAAMYNQCPLCANTTILAFQDINGFVQVANLTSSGWSTTQLGNDMNPTSGTGLALQPFYRPNQADQINLYYQKADTLNMTLATYGFGDPGWSLNVQTYDTFPFGSPIAAASAFSNDSSNGFESWIQVLSLGGAGVRVNTWEATINDWAQDYATPSLMANSTGNQKMYGPLAMTPIGGAYAVTQVGDEPAIIENWHLQDDFVTWQKTSEIDAW